MLGGTHVVGDREVIQLLTKLKKRTGNLAPVFGGSIDKSVSLFFRRQFDTSGAIGMKPWAPLRPVTKRKRPRPGGNRGGVGRPLWDFARLRGSLVAVGPESVRVVKSDRYERGTTVPHAIHHQRGYTVRKWGRTVFKNPRRVPAREIIPDPMPRAIVGSWARVLERYLMEGKP